MRVALGSRAGNRVGPHMFDARAHTRLNDPVLIRWYPALGALTGSSAAFGFDDAEAEDALAPGLRRDTSELRNSHGAGLYKSTGAIVLVRKIGPAQFC